VNIKVREKHRESYREMKKILPGSRAFIYTNSLSDIIPSPRKLAESSANGWLNNGVNGSNGKYCIVVVQDLYRRTTRKRIPIMLSTLAWCTYNTLRLFDRGPTLPTTTTYLE